MPLSPTTHTPVTLRTANGTLLGGDLVCPEAPIGLVVFAHGSGSSRHSPRNRFVASLLHERGCATLLLDLLTPDEDAREQAGALLRFDVTLLAGRVAAALAWARNHSQVGDLALGLFGSSTGAAAALVAAAALPAEVSAVVSRGGRPDLAGEALAAVRAPTLLVVGARDHDVLALNRQAFDALRCPKRLELVPGATHLFEEPGTLETAGRLAASWFEQAFLGAGPALGATT
jgi:dienelactone hydrolase